MAILAECPRCHKKQTVKNKRCLCGEDLDRAKKSKRVKYWVTYRLPEGKQRREAVRGEGINSYSIEDARAFESKRKVQKREHKIFDMLPESKMTFNDLATWYLSLEKVKALASFDTVKTYVNKFTRQFGETILNQIKPADIENLQAKRMGEGLKAKTVDDEVNYTKGMIIKAFDNDLVGGDVLKVFRRVKKTLKGHSNRRDRVLTTEEFVALHKSSLKHVADILILGYWAGMRRGEITNLTWDKVDLKSGFIYLEASDTKEGMPKAVPIASEVGKVLIRLPRPIHGGHVFLYKGKPIKRFDVSLSKACGSADILWGRRKKGGFIFHDLRHTFITDMRRAGVQRTVTMAITGHAVTDMNERYDTIEAWEKLEAIRLLEKFRSVDQSVDQEISSH